MLSFVRAASMSAGVGSVGVGSGAESPVDRFTIPEQTRVNNLLQ